MSERSPQKIKKLRKQADRLRFFSRSSLYIARTIALIFLGVMLCVLAFVSCARLANLYILVNEGMALRIECVLQDGPREELDSYFTGDCIASDGRLYDATYQPYTVTSYNYILEFSHIRVWPWLSDLSVDVLEQADRIVGTANSNAVDPDSDPPPWTPIRYRLTVSKVNGSWRISNITTLTVDPKIDPLPGALEFLNELRSMTQAVIISDTFTEFAMPLMKKLGWPTLFCNSLIVAPDGEIIGHKMRVENSKYSTVKALQSIGFETIGIGDSYNDLAMIQAGKDGFLFRTTDQIRKDHPELPVFDEYDDLLAAIKKVIGA